MSFEQDGFLADDHKEWVDRTRRTHAPWLEFVHDLNRQSMRTLPLAVPSQTDNREVLAALIFGRVLQSFQGTIMLAEKGLASDARTLIRSAAESAIALGGLASGLDLVGLMQEDHDKQVLSQANSLLGDEEKLAENASAEQVDRLRATVADIKKRYASGGPTRINWGSVASRSGFNDLYALIYRPMSGDGAHVTLAGLTRHIEEAFSGKVSALRFGPDALDLNDTLQASASVALHALEALGRIFPRVDVDGAIRGFLRRYELLRQEEANVH